MKILLLGPERKYFVEILEQFGDTVISTSEKLFPDSDVLHEVDMLISYGCRHILKPEILNLFPNKAINLHISYLPWNRGADPNLWSFLDDTKKGVSIHLIDPGVDTGDILAQREITWYQNDTLKTTYDRLSIEIVSLFRQVWADIRAGRLKGTPQPVGGSFHKVADRQKYLHLLVNGWDTSVADILRKGPGRGVS